MSFNTPSFGGFGQSNNNQSSTSGFGGFGSNNNNTTGGFGSSNTTAFGANNNASTSNSLFGNPGSGFSTTGGFNTGNSAFGGTKPAFGGTTAPSTGGLFGTSTTTTANSGFGGGFGSTSTPSSTPFGGSLFGGGNKFGTNTTTSTGTGTGTGTGSTLFGGGFGSTAGTSFGAANNPGFGTNIGDPPGTGQVQYTATNEKEPANPTQSNSYQNILFMEPYKKWSGEELRLADYNKGQRTGTTGGGFGGSGFGGTGFGSNTQNTGFGGTSTSSTGLFGNNQTATAGFGSTATNTGGFNSGTGLFSGGNKPATSGLFGNTTQPTQTGGIFGSSSTPFGGTGNTGNAFGSTNTGTGGGIFGSNQNNPKPGGFNFGTPATTTGGFGSTATGNAFGNNTSAANTGSGLFGGTTQTGSTGGLFGNTGQQGATAGFGSGFGTQNQNTGGSLFGNNNPKPSLFGTSNANPTAGGLFSNNNTTSTPFGGTTTNQPAASSIFGPKPTNTTSGLFGSNNNQTGTTTGGLFGLGSNTQNQQNATSSIFGLGQNQPQKPTLFPTSTQPTGGSLFGGQTNQQSSGLFGLNNSQQQSQSVGLGGSLFGNTQNAQSAPQSLSTSINDISAFGPPSLFSSLPNTEASNPGPLATPLSGASKARSRSILPMYKLSPANSPAFVTPQKRGFGFSYSTYGTPSSPSSVASTPGKLGQSLMLGSISRGLSKSISTSSLRRSFNVEDSILSPGAFSASSGARHYGSTGSHKKLIINRDMRSDLFTSPSKEKQSLDAVNGARKLAKRVSFDTSTVGAIENGTEEGDRQSLENSTNSAQDMGYLRPSTRALNGANGAKPASVQAAPEMEQVKGNELAIVHEEESPASTVRSSDPGLDREAGAYWMQPSREEIESMNRVQRQKVHGFTVGRENVGSVRFKMPVDLSNINLDELFGGIVDLVIRQATVYPNPAKKPPVGKGLNVPALISLEQSWPRDKHKRKLEEVSGHRFNRHVEKLKRIPDTVFENYDKDTGVWTFSVEHFTTYGLDDDDDYEDETATDVETNMAPRDKPASIQKPLVTATGTKIASPDTDPDDTFEFRRKRRAVPGAFDGADSSDEDDLIDATRQSSFLSDRHIATSALRATSDLRDAIVPTDDNADAFHDATGEDDGLDASLYYQNDMALQEVPPSPSPIPEAQQTPGGIMRARMRALKESTLPSKIQVAGGDDWTETLHKSVNARGRTDRAALKALKETAADLQMDEHSREDFQPLEVSNKRVVSDGHGFATSIDLMNSLFEKAKAPGPVQASPARGFLKWPYQKEIKESDLANMDAGEKAYRGSIRPSWGPDGTLVYGCHSHALGKPSRKVSDSSPFFRVSTISDTAQQQFIHVVRLAEPSSAKYTSKALQAHMSLHGMALVNGVPTARVESVPSLKAYFDDQSVHGPAGIHEKSVWELASILFDDISANSWDEAQTRRATLSAFWEKLAEEDCSRSIAAARTSEEKAIACLSGHRVEEACKYLLEGKNFRLATLVALIGTNDEISRDLAEQVKDWTESNAISEITEPIRAIYELLAGNVCLSAAKQNAPTENRAESFIISRRFGLNWKQAFGLRLWYGVATDEDISAAVDLFRSDIEQGREPRPKPWFVEQGIAVAWDDPKQTEREDVLWGLLKLFADKSVEIESVLEPANLSPLPFDSRLSWQLGRALIATGKVSFSQQKADAATISFAEQLTAEGPWMLATWAFSHLSSPSRARAIQNHFSRYAGRLCKNPSAWKELRVQPWLPRAWAYEALALYVRSVEDDGVMELEFLRKAGNYREAHRALVTKVGPQAVIERDYGLLGMADLLRKHTVEIPGWNQGGAVYWTYRQVQLGLRKGGTVRLDLLEQLLGMLKDLKKQDVDMEMRERAAVYLMTSQLAEVRQDCIRDPGMIVF